MGANERGRGEARGRVPTGAADLAPELLASLRAVEGGPLTRTRTLYLGLYTAMADGRLPSGTRLPPSRELAALLGLGRNTVTSVYEQLAAERLVVADGRRGTRVAVPPPAPAAAVRRVPVRLSVRSARPEPARPGGRAFSPGEPDASLFPRRAWARALAHAARLPAAELGYRAAPLPALREAIARWLATRRALAVEPESIVITSGTRQSLSLAATLFADPGARAWVESPGYAGAGDAFAGQGLEVVPCAVDEDGFVVPAVGRRAPTLAYLTPCFQYPTGVALAPARRAALLALSAARGTVLFEDDYDSEFRGADEPRPALAAEAAGTGATVLSAGTFSKLAFPAARVAWLVVPPEAAERAEACLRALGGGHNAVAQAAVASLLDDGTVARHAERARAVYRHRREVLLAALGRARHLAPAPGPAGSFSLLVELGAPLPIGALETALADAGFAARPIERFVVGGGTPRHSRRLVLGLGNVEALAVPERLAALDALVGRLARSTRAKAARG